MNPNLFKSTEFYQRRYHNFATVLTIPLALLVLFLVLFSLIASKEVTVTSVGQITPTKVIASIQSTSDHTVTSNHLSENKTVKKGDLLVSYAETLEASQKQAIETQLDSYRRQKTGLETLKSSLQQNTNLFGDNDEFGYGNTYNNFANQANDINLGVSRTNTEVSNQAAIANNTIAAIDSQIASLRSQIDDYKELYNAISNRSSSLSSDNPHKDTLNSYLSQIKEQPDSDVTNQYLSQITSSISNLDSSIASLEIQKAGTGSPAAYDNSAATKVEALRSQFLQNADQQLTTLQTQITDLENQLKQTDSQLQDTQLTAPESGVIHLNEAYKGKNLLPKGTEIAQIYPSIQKNQDVLITYYVSSAYMTNLKKGQTVRLSLEKIGNQPLVITGKISSIASSATETKEGSLFKIEAKARLSEQDSKLVRYGLQGRVTSVIARKTFFDYYKDKLVNQGQ
ncbi:Competence-stimulating peptide ABC transporter permease protein ComB [Streptococcus sp. DD11]|uniref:bacteriocin secretion accessory protein n=1 Tax=Streptococcus sp. DD11 TaxID=1777879 RepID=UPI00079B9E07|nr:bacteriocin secretion accessory protein [Streptococcus sp. DD11]KXT84110.1 Competence-stimulating peptide ABC transporter permease protein ComB [Streptococcus sp. DD11]